VGRNDARVKDLFISYAHTDRDTAERLAALFQQAGLSVWWDPQLRAGQKFAAVIEQTLQEVRCVVVLWSPASVNSDWVRAEAGEGLRLDKLVPVAIDQATPPLIFRALHTVWLQPADLSAEAPAFQRLVADVRARIKDEPASGGGDTASSTGAAQTRPSSPGHWRLWLAMLVAAMVLLAAGLSGVAAYLLDRVTATLAVTGLAPMLTETVLLVGAGLVGGVLLWRSSSRRGLAWFSAAALLVAALVGTAWLERLLRPPPDHLFGQVHSPQLQGLQVMALDVLQRPLSLRAVPVDSADGRFGTRLEAAFADRPYWVEISRAGCESRLFRVAWGDWRERRDLQLDFQCE
jgi:hypothetical protein